jgi:hypothetical protein
MSKISFKANRNQVTANTYVAHEVYKRNEAIINELGGKIIRGAGTFKAEFPSAKIAKQFVEQAITSISKREYNATRKTEPKKVATPKATVSAPKSGKGKNKAEVVTIGGKQYTVNATNDGLMLVPTKKVATPTPKKGKGKKTTSAPKQGKGKAFDFGKLKGKGKAYNTKAAAMMRDAGLVSGTKEFDAVWEIWKSVR